ncbi:regucalcin-like isoform X2 [Castor canadensis]|uniref:Regucalcin-like isoform X2 n=4 Tax=Castor canadensis TaxID=51338 RepID=A0AC58LN53_CASCN
MEREKGQRNGGGAMRLVEWELRGSSPESPMASPRIEAVIREQHRMAECPVWEEEMGQLVYVDIHAKTVCRWNPVSREVQAVGLSHRVGCVALRHKGSYVVASGTCLGLLDWGTRQVQWLAWLDRDKPHNRFNDGKVDPAGRFVAGTMPEPSAPGVWEPRQGSLYSLHADYSVVRHLERLGIPNGLDWSPDHRTFYHVDSLEYCVRAYDYDVQTGGIENPRLLYRLQEDQGMPDGLCVDTAGTLWVACIDAGRVIRLDPETGTRLCTVEMPVSRVTSCCFGGPDYSELYVTSAADGLSPQQLCREPQAGHVFKSAGICPALAWCPHGPRMAAAAPGITRRGQQRTVDLNVARLTD